MLAVATEEEPKAVIDEPRSLEIFLDMDGVVANFVGPALEVHGYDPNNFPWPKGVFDFETALGVTTEQFWKPIDYHADFFWSRLPKFEWADELARICNRFGRWRFLSSPSQHYGSSAGKVKWIREHFHGAGYIFTQSHAKQLLAAPGRVLIDDRDRNCEDWENAGGTAILIPQVWNSAWNKGELNIPSYVTQELRRIQQAV